MGWGRRWGAVALCWAALVLVGVALVAEAVASSASPRGAASPAEAPAASHLRARATARDRPAQVFPVRGPHWDRGPVGAFGAPRSGGRTHEGFDVVAACGTKLVAARGGRVLQNRFDPVLDGNEVLIHARGTGRNYRYSHLRKPAIVDVGDVVETGQRIGSVGKTGNARTVGCHLHFEMRRHGQAIDPDPALRRWDRGS